MKTFGVLDESGEVRGIICGQCLAGAVCNGIPASDVVEIDQCDPVKVCDVCGKRILASWRLNYLDRLNKSTIISPEEKQKLGEEMLRS